MLYLLAACQNYDMVQVQSLIRDKVNCGYPAPIGVDAFRAYVIAGSKGQLFLEMEKATRLTLGYPMTFETLGETLQLFDGCAALRDLARFRRCCRDGLLGASRPSSGSATCDIREFGLVLPISLGHHRERYRIFSQGGYIKFLHGIWTS